MYFKFQSSAARPETVCNAISPSPTFSRAGDKISCIGTVPPVYSTLWIKVHVRIHAKFGEDPTKSLGGEEKQINRQTDILFSNCSMIIA